jgi:hypothetical protein
MSSISTYAGSAGSGWASGGTVTWSNTANYTGAPDGSDSQTGGMGASAETISLDAWNFAPSVPGGSTINGLQYVGIYSKQNNNRVITIQAQQLSAGGFNSSGPTTTSATGDALTTSAATYTWGASTDLWLLGAELTVANVNSAVEGTGPTLSVFFEAGAGASADEVNADAVQQTVWYTASATPLPGAGAFDYSYQFGSPLFGITAASRRGRVEGVRFRNGWR